MHRIGVGLLLLWFLASAHLLELSAQRQDRPLVISVAASLGDVMSELANRFEATARLRVTLNIGGSNALARQIIEGAPADVYVSADNAQMSGVEKADRVVPGSRFDLLTNQLAVVVSSNQADALRSPQALAGPTIRRIAMGNPSSVPAGVYGRQWLERLQLWAQVQQKVVPLANVRSALAAVREGHAQAAIVYATDARTAPELTVAYLVRVDEAPRIIYPAALVRGPRESDAKKFIDFLRSTDARAVFERAGFGVLPQ